MYTFERRSFGKFSSHKLTDSITGESIEIIPEAGLNINNLYLNVNQIASHIIVGSSNYEEFQNNKIMFEGAKLFPWVGRIPNGSYNFNYSNHQLELNSFDGKHAIHGFVYNKEFKIEKIDEQNGKLQYSYLHNYSNGFPFPFEMIVEFHLSKNGLSVSTNIKNTGLEPLPFADGWHPYFLKGVDVNNLKLKLPGSEQLELNENLVPNGNIFKNENFIEFNAIGNMNLDSCFKMPENTLIGETILRNEIDKVDIRIWQETGKNKYNYLVIFTPDTRKSIAIEPWTSPPNSFNDPDNTLILKPMEEIHFSMGIQALPC